MVIKNLTGISLIIRKVNETKLSNCSAKVYGEILGLHLRKYVANKSVVFIIIELRYREKAINNTLPLIFLNGL